MRVFNPFGPKIAITKIPKKIMNKINKEVDLIVNNKSRSKKSDYSKELVGQVKQEIRLSNKFVNKHILKFIFFTFLLVHCLIYFFTFNLMNFRICLFTNLFDNLISCFT